MALAGWVPAGGRAVGRGARFRSGGTMVAFPLVGPVRLPHRLTAPGCLALTLFAALFLPPAGRAADPARPPNVVVILADDLGYADPGCQGGKEVPTPNIDSLAKNGVRCTQGYVSCPYCSPTRAGLLTGRYQQRFGHEYNEGQGRLPFGLPLEQKTVADHLKGLGYATAAVGKWHLGNGPKFRPMQ